MFELLEQTTARPRRWTKFVGIAIIAAVLGSIIMVQKIWPQTAKDIIARAKEILVAPLPPPSSQPAAPEPPRVKLPPKVFREVRNDNVLHAPPVIPTVINADPEPPADASPNPAPCPACIPGSTPGSNGPGGFGPPVVVTAAPPPTKAPEPPKPAAPTKPLVVGGKVQLANLIHKVVPQYPPMAKAAHVSGVVTLGAVIAKDGTIEQLRVLSGNPLLVNAAMEAVKQWIYKPTLLNGQPVEVITQIDVNFTLNM